MTHRVACGQQLRLQHTLRPAEASSFVAALLGHLQRLVLPCPALPCLPQWTAMLDLAEGPLRKAG